MIKIGLLSDTHGYLDSRILDYVTDCDEIWHAGDVGSIRIIEKLQTIAPVEAVFGNIDGSDIRSLFPKQLRFHRESIDFWMTHIGGSPGRYNQTVRDEIKTNPPDVFICGHSHILKIVRDKKHDNMLFINPGAAGKRGFHEYRTCVRFEIEAKKIKNMEVLQLEKTRRYK
jgi:putative phosphoesterase